MERKEAVKMTERRARILTLLEKWGILGLGQLDGLLYEGELPEERRLELFFNSAPRDGYRGMTYKAMSRIEGLGWVRGNSFTNLPVTYTLTTKGHAALRKEKLNALPSFSGEVAESIVRHELLVSGIGLTLSVLRRLRVRTEWERYLASSGREETAGRKDFGLSDLWISDAVQPKAVEVERTQKSARRYEELWRGYREDLPPGGVVLYVVCFPGGCVNLLKRAEKLGADHVYFCQLSDFKASRGRGPFVGYRGGQVCLGDGQGGLQ